MACCQEKSQDGWFHLTGVLLVIEQVFYNMKLIYTESAYPGRTGSTSPRPQAVIFPSPDIEEVRT